MSEPSVAELVRAAYDRAGDDRHSVAVWLAAWFTNGADPAEVARAIEAFEASPLGRAR